MSFKSHIPVVFAGIISNGNTMSSLHFYILRHHHTTPFLIIDIFRSRATTMPKYIINITLFPTRTPLHNPHYMCTLLSYIVQLATHSVTRCMGYVCVVLQTSRLLQERVVQRLPRCKSFRRLKVENAFEQMECLLHFFAVSLEGRRVHVLLSVLLLFLQLSLMPSFRFSLMESCQGGKAVVGCAWGRRGW